MSLLDGRLAQEHLKQRLHGTPQDMKFANLKRNFQSYQPPVHHKARAKIHAWFKLKFETHHIGKVGIL